MPVQWTARADVGWEILHIAKDLLIGKRDKSKVNALQATSEFPVTCSEAQ